MRHLTCARTIGRAVVLLAAMLASARASQAQVCADAVQAVVPFVYDEPRIYVPVSAAGGALGLFILDTGTGDSLIDTAVAARTGARTVGEAVLRGAGRGELDVDESGPVTLLIGQTPLRLETVHVGALDARLRPTVGRQIGGLIGAQFFREHVVSVDFARRLLELRDPRTFVYAGAGVRLPFHLADGAPIVTGSITLADGTRLPLRLLVDLGAQADLLLAGPFVSAHPELARRSPQVVEPLDAGVGGETRYAFTRLTGLNIGPLSAGELIAGLSVNGSLRGGYYDGLLGAAFLQRYRVTFDYARREIILEPNLLAEPDRFDRSGAFVVQELNDAHRFTIHWVAAGTPAADAGLAVGDVVRRVGALSADKLTLNDIRRALSAEDDAPVTIIVERGGRMIELAVRPRALL